MIVNINNTKIGYSRKVYSLTATIILYSLIFIYVLLGRCTILARTNGNQLLVWVSDEVRSE